MTMETPYDFISTQPHCQGSQKTLQGHFLREVARTIGLRSLAGIISLPFGTTIPQDRQQHVLLGLKTKNIHEFVPVYLCFFLRVLSLKHLFVHLIQTQLMFHVASDPRTPSRHATRRFTGAPLEGLGARYGIPAALAKHQDDGTTLSRLVDD